MAEVTEQTAIDAVVGNVSLVKLDNNEGLSG